MHTNINEMNRAMERIVYREDGRALAGLAAIVMRGGEIALDGTPAEVFSQVQKVKALDLDVPPMAELAMRLNAGGLRLPDGILTVADMVKELKKALCPSK